MPNPVLDALNLAQAWLSCVLYHYRVYPSEAFVFRTLYGVQVPVPISAPLNNYIAGFIKQLEGQVQSLNSICIAIQIN